MLPGWATNSVRALLPCGIDTGTNTLAGIALDSAAKRICAIFVAPASENINGFTVLQQGNTGTVTNIIQADLYAVDSTLTKTGSSLATVTYTPTNAYQAVTFGSPYAVTAGTVYMIELQNVAGAPASNYTNYRAGLGGGIIGDRFFVYSTDSGSTYKALGSYQYEIVLYPNYASSGLYGTIQRWTEFETDYISLYNTSGSRIAAVSTKFNFKTDVKLWGIRAAIGRSGSPTHTLDGKVWNSSGTVLSTAANTWLWSTSAGASIGQWFWTTPYTLSANTDYYIGISPNGATAGDSSNYYTMKAGQYNSSTLRPAQVGPAIDCFQSTGASITWAQTGSNDAMFKLMAFVEVTTSAGGSASILCQRGMNGGFPR